MSEQMQSSVAELKQSQQPGSSATAQPAANKKKFGKNLTKIVQSQQKVLQADNRSNSHSSTCKNGLLLLSMNKKTSGLLATSEAANSGTTVNVSAGIASHPNTKETVPQLDAWGVHGNPSTTGNNTKSTGTHVKSSSPRQEVVNLTQQVSNDAEPKKTDNHSSNYDFLDGKSVSDSDRRSFTNSESKDLNNSTLVSTDDNGKINKQAPWDEYGGRNSTSTLPYNDERMTVPAESNMTDPDKEYMTNKAKERALAIQKAEEMRLQEQRSRAAARLRELNQNQHSPSMIGKSMSNNTKGDQKNNAKIDELNVRQESQEHPKPNQQNTLIHLTSYEDRDRGVSAQSGQPRMLFDPKSGSMVAVKAREEQNNNLNKPKKALKKTQDSRNTANKGATKKDSNASTERKARKFSDGDVSGKFQLLKNSHPIDDNLKVAKKMQPVVLNRTRRSLPRTCGVLYKRNKVGINNTDDASEICCADGCEGDLGYGAHSVPGGRTRNPDAYAKYKREQQQLAASRGTNTNSFRNGTKQLQTSNKSNSNSNWDSKDTFSDSSKIGLYQRQQRYDSITDSRTRSGKVLTSGNQKQTSLLYTGFNPSEEKSGYELGMQKHHEWITADDKLELVGMDDEEPTLKPTAKIFAPSQAALAAAAAATLHRQDSRDSDDEDASNDMLIVPGMDDDLDEDEDNFEDDDEEIDDHHRHTVNKAALDILEDDDYDVDNNIDQLDHQGLNGIGHHHHLPLDDPMVFGFDATQDIHELIPSSSKSGTSRLVQLEEIESISLLAPSFATAMGGHEASSGVSVHDDNRLYNAPIHQLFPFAGLNPWGTSSATSQASSNNTSDWDVDILNLARGNQVVSGLSNVNANNSSGVGGLFGTTADNSFGVPSGSSWGTGGVVPVVVPAFEGLNLNGTASAAGDTMDNRGGD